MKRFLVLLLILTPLEIRALEPLAIRLDARQAHRGILHADLRMPARPGPLTLVYPKWIPGEHAPSGPITDLAGLSFRAGEQSLAWSRDPFDLFELHVEIPAGATELEVGLDFLLPTSAEGFSGAASTTPNLAVISWNHVLLYPKGTRADDLVCAPSLLLPADWKYGTALRALRSGSPVEFAPVSLTTLVDSPVLAGRHLQTIELSAAESPAHVLHVACDNPAGLLLAPDARNALAQLVKEGLALFGSHHYRDYSFLLTLSDHVAHFGLEHHESSDNRLPERTLIDPNSFLRGAGLLPHEFVHSWNGKYRRPVDMITPHYQQALNTSLLWVYEGLTTYLGDVLTVRSGLWSETIFRESLAQLAAQLDQRSGRSWRPLVDTTVAAQLLYSASPGWTDWRRSVDFYDEGILIWLEADVLIRQRSEGQKSLDDFCRAFCGGPSGGPPAVKAYQLSEVVRELTTLTDLDWSSFFQTRIERTNPRAPLGGIEAAGWQLQFSDALPAYIQAGESTHKVTDVSFSLGFVVNESGRIEEVRRDSPADHAGIAPSATLVAVNGRRWNPTLLREAIAATKNPATHVELLIEHQEFFRTHTLEYSGGERYPFLERIPGRPDLLTGILQPRAR